MAVNAYLTIETITNGPSTSRQGAIDVLSHSITTSNTATYGVGSSGQESKAGRADFGNLSVMKVTDATTPFLFSACVNGTNVGKVVLVYDKPVNGQPQDYYRITIDDALVTSHSISGSSENPTESVTFAYQSIEIAYAAEKDDATLDSFVPKGFSVQTLQQWAA
jgi:type VI secretion system secreted protein Hcp